MKAVAVVVVVFVAVATVMVDAEKMWEELLNSTLIPATFEKICSHIVFLSVLVCLSVCPSVSLSLRVADSAKLPRSMKIASKAAALFIHSQAVGLRCTM